MVTATANSVRDLARSRENYRHMRWKAFGAIRDSKSDAPIALNSFLAKSFLALKFSVRAKKTERPEPLQPLQALPFLDRDWPIVERLNSDHRTSTKHSYLRLTADYIIANKDAIARLQMTEIEFCRATLELDAIKMRDVFEVIAPVDRQALFSFKLYAASHSVDARTIADYFANNPHSNWVKQQLLYPLTFYFINLPSDEDFEQILNQVFPSSNTTASERLVLNILLRNRTENECSLALKCYVALLCHPFDALNFLILHYESRLSANKIASDFELVILEEINATIACPRLANLLGFMNGSVPPYSSAPRDLPICGHFQLGDDRSKFFERYVAIDHADHPCAETRGIYEPLERLRCA